MMLVCVSQPLEKLGVYCKELQEANFHASPLIFTLSCALESKKTGTEQTLIYLSHHNLTLVPSQTCGFVVIHMQFDFNLCRFILGADENVKGAGFTHEASLLLAPPHSAPQRQKHRRYVLPFVSSTN